MAITEQGLMAALGTVQDPLTGQDFVSTRALRNLQVTGADVAFDVELGYPAKSQEPALRARLEAAARTLHLRSSTRPRQMSCRCPVDRPCPRSPRTVL